MLAFDCAGLEINFEEFEYPIVEGESLNSRIRLEFRANQNPFTITFRPVTINSTIGLGLEYFIDTAYIDSKAISGILHVTNVLYVFSVL